MVVCIRQMEKAYALLAEMKEVGVEANSHCYNPLIMGFSTKVTLTLSSCMGTSSFGKRHGLHCDLQQLSASPLIAQWCCWAY